MNNKNTKLILFAAVIIAAGSTAFAGGPHRGPDGIDTAARIVDLVLRVVRPVETVVVTPAPVVTQTVYTTPVVYSTPVVTQTVVTREVYTAPVVYTQTYYSAPPAPRPRYYQPAPPRGGKQGPGNNRPGPGPRR